MDSINSLRQQMHRWDNRNTANFAAGRQEGREEGREEERLKALVGKIRIAENLKLKGIDLRIISEATDFSIEEIIAL